MYRTCGGGRAESSDSSIARGNAEEYLSTTLKNTLNAYTNQLEALLAWKNASQSSVSIPGIYMQS